MRSHCSGDEAEVHRTTAVVEDRLEDAVVAGRVGAVDPLAVQAADAGAEPHADHAEGGEVDLGVAVGVGSTACSTTRATSTSKSTTPRGRSR